MRHFIYTEVINCGKIGKIALESFSKYHPDLTVSVFGTPDDFKWIRKTDKMIFIDVKRDTILLEKFTRGHEGTAYLWASIIKRTPAEYILHFDSDVIFRGSLIYDILHKLNNGYDLVGPIRNYKNNPHGNTRLSTLNDVVGTSTFGYNATKIDTFDIDTLSKMCQGVFNPLGHEVIDFFDPVSFNILKNGGKVSFLSFDDVGGMNDKLSRANAYPELNDGPTQFKIDFGHKVVHFSAVGSGMNFYINRNKIASHVPQSYIDYALDRYAIFCKIFYNEDIGIDVSKYKTLLNVNNWY